MLLVISIQPSTVGINTEPHDTNPSTNPSSLFHTALPSSRSVFYPPFQRLFTVDSALGKSGRGLILKAERRHVGYQGPELQGNQGTSSGGYVQTASKRKKKKKHFLFGLNIFDL